MENNENFVDNFKPSTLENIDFALFNWVDQKIDARCKTNDGFKKIPVIWASAERSFQIKNYKDLRDSEGSMIPPFISVERGKIKKELATKGIFQPNTRGYDRISYTTVINQEKTSKYANNSSYNSTKKLNFATKKTPQVVYQTKSIRLPTYFEVEYSISIKTNFLQHLNEIIQCFISFTRRGQHFLIQNDGFQYEAFMGEEYELEDTASNMEGEERTYISKMSVRVIGYFIGEDINQNDQLVRTEENFVSIKFPKESLIVQETEKKPRERIGKFGQQVGETVTALKKVYTIGDGVNSVYTINHAMNTRDMYISVRENFGDYSKVEVAINFIDLNNVLIDMGDVISTDSYVVLIIG